MLSSRGEDLHHILHARTSRHIEFCQSDEHVNVSKFRNGRQVSDRRFTHFGNWTNGIHCRPIEFTMKNLDTFETVLIMSTLAPDYNEECDANTSVNSNVTVPTNARIVDSTTKTRKRNRILSQASDKQSNDQPRSDSESSKIFDFGRNPSRQSEIVRKKRRTEAEPESFEQFAGPAVSPRIVRPYTESEVLNLTFAEESEATGGNDVVMQVPSPIDDRRRQRLQPQLNDLFKLCFRDTIEPSCNFGQILMANSDAEDDEWFWNEINYLFFG